MLNLQRHLFHGLRVVVASSALCTMMLSLSAADICSDDISFVGELGSDGATLTELGPNHFQVALKTVPERPSWTNMVQFTIQQNAKGNTLRIDTAGISNETGIRQFVSYSYDRETWYPVPRTVVEEDGKKFARLQFPEFEHDTVYVGGEVPLSYEMCVATLKEFEQHKHATLHSLGKSLRGRDIYRLTITDPESDVPAEKRWAHHFVNQHCYEYNAQWRMIGMIRYLLGEAGADARKRHIWHFVVQMNVDGPSAGFGRANSQGLDMNRSYSAKGSDSQEQAFESYLVQRDLEDLVTSETPITTTWSMHTWDGPLLEPMVRPGKEIGSVVGPWTDLRDILIEQDTQGQFKKLNNLGDANLTPKAWCSGTFVQFGVTAFCCEGGGQILHLNETLHTGEVLAKTIHQFYGQPKP